MSKQSPPAPQVAPQTDPMAESQAALKAAPKAALKAGAARKAVPAADQVPDNDHAFVENFLSYLLSRAATQVSSHYHRMAKQQGLGVAEWRVLGSLWHNPLTVGELAAFTLYQQPTLTKIIDRMVAAGLVARAADPADRRRVRVQLTKAGDKIATDLLPRAAAQEAEILSGYSSTDIQTLKQALKLLIDRTDARG